MAATVGRKIKEARYAAGLTQVQLCEIADVSQGYLSQIESGARRPSLDALKKLSDALAVSDDTFLRWVDLATAKRKAAA